MRIFIIPLLVILAALGLLWHNIGKLEDENTRLKANQEALLTDIQQYKVADSLSAVTVKSLTLELDEYKKLRAEDYKLIKQLRNSKNKPTSVTSTQTVKTDTILVPIRVEADTLRCFTYESTWTDISGCIDLTTNQADIQLSSREALKIVETITYKRFLGFLWKTNKVKSRQIDILSENPSTQIISAEHIIISK